MTSANQPGCGTQVRPARSKDYDISRLRELALDAIQQSVIIADANQDGRPIVFVNRAFSDLTGYTSVEAIGRSCDFLAGPETNPEKRTEMRDALDARAPFTGLLLNYRKDGSAFWNEISLVLLDDGQSGSFWMGTQTDVTERRDLEARLRESQRMEAIGKLSGGIAHDFNNILALILGNAEIIASEAVHGSLTREAAADIMEAADGGSKLVTRMLQYARGENGELDEVPVNAVIEDVVTLLARTISDRIHVQTDLSPAVGRVRLDRTLFETALMNLVLNARDAMPAGGTVKITTRRRVNAGPKLGTAALVSVSDSGTGMDAETIERAFEPFFTTKIGGRGNGLGLAMVYNFVKQSGGDVSIDSVVGQGTTVAMLLPVEEPSVRAAPPHDARESILLVEDDPKIRKVLALHLDKAGYSVAEVGSAEEAIDLLTSGFEPALLISDIRLRDGMTGIELARRLASESSRMPILLMTGFAEELGIESDRIDGISVLRKPFRIEELLSEAERHCRPARTAGEALTYRRNRS
ncbi:hybrid sensor histidine kinase/response regulator [Sphingomonas spermidinifaciens]|uniref:histidine kinase n=1 Tax=Sphingomonas spermidinifaciens TaxID=1141889 RepID=A0A2A4B3B3_9SPHN|nr:ATP-binding protein [Sphingomonas spermidinifaciens]PCD02174.1 hybrid sensor histidine kinase/response regulator [Sphingomonas spermidinifaciens]